MRNFSLENPCAVPATNKSRLFEFFLKGSIESLVLKYLNVAGVYSPRYLGGGGGGGRGQGGRDEKLTLSTECH